ncbi:SPASM domain-containing protein [Promicromonospora sp. CA-289599]|uniref:SPASM domain-containing protein n=1 Tax=Promicromonospora sp. CA-289599 TaxID=3240014 RepID=UPI003D8EB017
MLDDQNVQAATAELKALGVAEVGVDHLRQVGRGIRDRDASMAELCGGCGDGVIAISATGEVWPCVFTRWMPVGNVQDTALAEVLAGRVAVDTTTALREAFEARGISDGCSPKCMPDRCDPECGPAYSPACKPLCGPKGGPCKPRGGCMPNYYG